MSVPNSKSPAWISRLQVFADRPWYPALLGLLVGLDNFVLVVPSDGLLVSSAMLRPRRWISMALTATIGAALGGMALAYAVDHFGIAALVRIHPGLTEGAYWRKSVEFYDRWGLLLAFAVSLTPLPQQPPIVLAGMAQAPLPGLGLALLGGRLIKYLILSFVGSHAPRMLGNLWGVQKELEKAGVHVDIPGKASHKD